MIDEENQVIIIGFGRFGQITGRFLMAHGIKATILDLSSENIDFLRKFGYKVFYGEATRLDLLHAAGMHKANLCIVAIDEPVKAIELVEIIQKHFPQVKILARAFDTLHAYEYMEKNIEYERETFGSALYLGEKALVALGVRQYRAYRAVLKFKKHEEQVLKELYNIRHDFKSYIHKTKEKRDELFQALEADHKDPDISHDQAWDSYSLVQDFKDEK